MENHSQPVSATATLKQLGMRACGTCVKAKAKCIADSESRKCQRCHRLDKDCRPSSPSSRKKPKSSQVAQLEKKLDSIVTLLTGSYQSRDEKAVETPSCPVFLLPSQLTPSTGQDTHVTPLEELSIHLGCPNPGHGEPRPHQSIRSNPLAYDFNIRATEADTLLADYQNTMARHMPFVVVPPFLTSDDLRREKPVLWKAIIIATCYSQPDRQEALGWKFMEDITTRILLKAEKSLDLLQGILVHLCWYHYHAVFNPQVTNLLHLTRALVTNLGYLRIKTVKDRRQLLMDDIEGTNCASTSQETSVLPGSEKHQQWRAVTGCFAITSVAVSNCRGMNPFQYSHQVEEAAKTLGETREYEGDRIIPHLCRLQSIALKISNLYNEQEDNIGLGSFPIKMYIKVLQAEFEDFKTNLPLDLQHNEILTSNYQMAEISLYELGFYSAFYPESEKAYRLSTLYGCLVAVKTFFSTHFTSDASFYPSDPYVKWVQMGYALLMGFKLCICNAAGWDLDHARQVLDFPTHLDILIGKLELVIQLRHQPRATSAPPATREASSRLDIFSRFLRQSRRFKAWYEAMLAEKIAPQVVVDSSYPTPPSFQLSNQDLDVAMEGFGSEQFLMNIDETFWQSFMNQNEDWTENWCPGTVG